MYYVNDLFDSPRFDNALTIHGLLSHGKRFKAEFDAVNADPKAFAKLIKYILERRPDDGMLAHRRRNIPEVWGG